MNRSIAEKRSSAAIHLDALEQLTGEGRVTYLRQAERKRSRDLGIQTDLHRQRARGKSYQTVNALPSHALLEQRRPVAKFGERQVRAVLSDGAN